MEEQGKEDKDNTQKTDQSKRFRFLNDLTDYYKNTCINISEDIAQDAIIYGIESKRIKNSTPHSGHFYISDDSQKYLCFAIEKSEKIISIQLNNISNVEFNDSTKNLKKYKKSKDEKFMQILINFTLYDFSFSSLEKISTFIKGLLIIFEQKRNNFIKNRPCIIDLNLNNLVAKHDQNYNDTYEGREFKNLSNDIGINPKELKKCVDKDGDGKITREEIMEYLNNKAYGNQFRNIFNTYASFKPINEQKNTDRSNQYGENTINPSELQLFFMKEQNENISMLEAYQIVCLYLPKISMEIKNKLQKKIQKSYIRNGYKINKNDIQQIVKNLNEKIKTGKIKLENCEDNNYYINLELSLKSFTNMFYSNLLSIYDKKKLFSDVDESHPLVDYFINSTHNTYLKGHQLIGESSTDTYEFAVLDGYRLLELDCYNGDGDKIKITHGYTLANSIFLVDILKVIKKNSFKKSNLPVILSIENHLDKKHQEIMAKNMKEILEDLYIFPNEKKPDFIPNLKDLENKFIIKCGGKRLWQNENIGTKKIKLKNNNLNIDNKLTKLIIKEENYDNISDSSDDDEEELPYENMPIIKTLYNSELKKLENDNIFLPNSTLGKSTINGSTTISSSIKNFSVRYSPEFVEISKEILDEEPDEEESIKSKEEEIYDLSLENIRGLCGVKLNFNKINEMKYQKWEFLTLKSTQYLKSFNNEKIRKEYIKLSNIVMMKAYPQKMDSTNYDIIKCWACGCQVAAINIQSMKDDFTLFNKVFFMQNNNCGYVLKPNKLLINSNIFENYKNPVAFFQLRILFIFNLSNLFDLSKISREKKAEVILSIYPLDNYGNTKKTNMKISDGLLFPLIDTEKIIKIPVFEKDLGGVMFKFNYEGKMFARACIPYCMMKNGYRKVPLFCNECIKREGSFIVGEFRLINIDKNK